MSQAESIARFENVLKSLSDRIEAIDEGMLEAPLNNWSPRGIISHLIGWNEYIQIGCTEVQKGIIPFYKEDAGEYIRKANAEFVQRFSSTPKEELLRLLRESGKKLRDYIESVPAENFSRDFGVRYEDDVYTVEHTFDVMTEDYEYHEKQIEEWAKALPS